MIQTANIGVGICGKEGRQATDFSDFSLQNFKSLNRLLFWHGRCFGSKSSRFNGMILYKNAAMVMQNMLFNIHSGFSAYAFYDEQYYALFHTLNTIFAPVAYYFYNKDMDWTRKSQDES
jgi:magnesium-transporting ATPase (P-type)